MTLSQMIIELFDNLGRPTDLSPLDRLDDNTTLNPTLWGYKQLQRWINQGYKAITTWRTPNGRFYKHRDMIERVYFQWGPHQLTGSHTYTTDGSALGYDDTQHTLHFYEDSYYEDNTPPAMVLVGMKNLGKHLPYEEVEPPTLPFLDVSTELQYQEVYNTLDADWVSLAYFVDAHTLYTLLPMPWVVEETEVTIYERGINWERFNIQKPLQDLYAILQIRVIDKKTNMEIASRSENFTHNLEQAGTPTEYFREGDYVYFDKHIDKEYTLQMEYYRQAEDLDSADAVPKLPERYHTPIIYWATYRGLLRQGENTDAYSIRGFLDMEMRSIIKEVDLDVDRYEGNFISGFMSGGRSSYGR